MTDLRTVLNSKNMMVLRYACEFLNISWLILMGLFLELIFYLCLIRFSR
ncbi:MAG: hypothetical protein ACI37Z_09000 [Candidatus Gastranaerophilaceae bacterium]